MRQICLLFACFLSLVGTAQARDGACEPITIFAAASTTDVINAISDAYEIETACSVSTVFAGSGALARQIAAGAPADLFLSANQDWMDWLIQNGTVKASNVTDLLSNELVLIVPQDSAFSYTPGDESALLAEIQTGKLAVGDPASVPAGAYALETLERLGISSDAAPHLVRAASVRHALAWVARGEAVAGIVYRTDALLSEEVRIAGTFPSIASERIQYPIALVGRTPNEAARSFHTHLQSYEAAIQFSEHGFGRASD